jgi:NADPH:quinone reductase-like Zn-dependent oxidoreductase
LSAEKLVNALGGANADGVLAEYVALKENAVCKFPDYLSFEEASTLPIAALTAWNAVVEQSELILGDTILIIGTGGVSCFALQFSKLSGYKIIITSSSDEKLKKAKFLGAHHLINYRQQENWEEAVLKLTNGSGVEQVVDVVGGRHISRSLKCVRSEGIVSMVGVIDGIKGEVDTGTIMMKAARVQGVETGSTEMYKRMLTAMDFFNMKPVIDKVFSFENTSEAFSYFKKSRHFGKICIRF